jgi:hypothetical protein
VVQAHSGRGPRSATTRNQRNISGGRGTIFGSCKRQLSQAHLKRSWTRIAVISNTWWPTKGMLPGCDLRSPARWRTTMPSRSRFGAARTFEARLLTRLKFKLASRFALRTHPCIGGRILFVTAAAGLVHFIANNGETISSTSQLHVEDKSQFSESLGTLHRAG